MRAVTDASDDREPPTVAVVDNYDSFANNLEQYLGEFACVELCRYDSVPDADGVVFSPGPGRPAEFPVMYDALETVTVPVLGVCLGHQAIADHFGGRVGYADRVVHGKQSPVEHDDVGVFAGLPSPMSVGRYHSLVVTDVPEPLSVVATGAGEVMGLTHRSRPVYGVQFHPESVLTPEGKALVENFVAIAAAHRDSDRDRTAETPDRP
ncbi:anthranilate/aminodeoxychorismate synthase component II [Halobacteriales archaeon SW_7_71_33]|nr:MAG: anthranilate/aminodeoxychorismate synthase component II [Halobacteriales archaeon SW_7_71_33]